MNAFQNPPISKGGDVNKWNDGELTDQEVARMSDEEISARMSDLLVQMADARHKEELLLEVLEKKDPELAAEMRKQMKR